MFAGGSPDKTVIEGKRVVTVETTIRELSQSIAMALTFASIQHTCHAALHTFPTLRVHPIGIDIILYNTLSDRLMLNCFKWSEQTFFLLWLVLHHNLFSFQELPKKYEKLTCGFCAYVENSNAMQEEPKYLVFENSFEVNDTKIVREYRSP